MKLPFDIDLTGKTAVVTGGSGVLCSVLAKALAQCGAKVAVIGRHIDKAQAVADEICGNGGVAIAVAADVTNRESVEAARNEINAKFGPCDILINGAGGNNPKGTTTNEYYQQGDIDDPELVTFFDLEQEGLEFVFDLNIIGTMLPSQVFAKDMVGRKGATVINMTSMNAFTPLTKIPAYSGAKAAVSNFTQWLAVHLSKVGVRVNAIAPGFFATEQNRNLLFNPDGTPTARTGKILAATPMERFGEPEELVGALLFLVSEEASGFVNGVVLPVDGGFSAYSGV